MSCEGGISPRSKIKGLGALLFSISIVVVGIFGFAQDSKSVTISQLLPEFAARPGETIEQVIQLYDDSLQGVTVYPVVYNFTADPNKEGAVLILTEEQDLKPDREWIKFEQTEIKLPEDGTLVDFPYTIEIPENGEPGTHLISIVFQTKPQVQEDQQGTAVYIGTNVATNIFLKVLGVTIDQLDVNFQSGTFLNTDQTLSAAERLRSFVPKTFFLKPPVDFLVAVENSGNTHQKPDGNIKIVNDFWGSDPEKLLVNAENRIVLPGTQRTFDAPSFGQGFMFGKYRATITLLYGDPLRPVTKEIVFWIVPVTEIAIVLGILLVIIVAIILIVKMSRSKREKNEKNREDRLRREITEQLTGKKVLEEEKQKGQIDAQKNETISTTSKKNRSKKRDNGKINSRGKKKG